MRIIEILLSVVLGMLCSILAFVFSLVGVARMSKTCGNCSFFMAPPRSHQTARRHRLLSRSQRGMNERDSCSAWQAIIYEDA
jgi:hypothetical protein